jgi:hypothetical protein
MTLSRTYPTMASSFRISQDKQPQHQPTTTTRSSGCGITGSIPDGCCPLCGIQLFQIRSSGKWGRRGSNNNKNRAIPRNVEGQVENGQCVSCAQALDPNSNQSTTKGDTLYIGESNSYGRPHGPGELIWDHGDRYVGNFFNGLRDGEGTLFLRDGKSHPSISTIFFSMDLVILFLVLEG